MLRKIIAKLFPFSLYEVIGESMFPTLPSQQRVIVYKHAYLLAHPKIGDVVALKDPRDNKILIKRIRKIEGEKYFVMGDNELHSTDSRKFGMLERRAILGKVIYPKVS